MRFSATTDVGCRRNGNEDFLFASDRETGPLPNLFVVADGMGGHNAGEVASQLAVTSLLDFLRTSRQKDVKKALADAISFANEKVLSLSENEPEKAGMGTTLVCCSVFEDGILVASVGDSRLYLYSRENLTQITKDHTVVGEMLRMGSISKKVAANHPKRHMLTRAVGAVSPITADFFEIPINGDEQILLCTDGLCNMVEDDRLASVLMEKKDTETKVSSLIEMAKANGGDDNITMILIDTNEV